MGWMCSQKNGREIKDIIAGAFRPYKVVDCAIVTMRTAYVAVQVDNDVEGYVVLLHYYKNGEICRKEIHESMGPYECNCPERILRLLTGPTNDWRQACQSNIDRYKRIKAGEPFTLAEPIRFGDGVRRAEFVKSGKYYTCTVDSVTCKLTKRHLNGATFEKDNKNNDIL